MDHDARAQNAGEGTTRRRYLGLISIIASFCPSSQHPLLQSVSKPRSFILLIGRRRPSQHTTSHPARRGSMAGSDDYSVDEARAQFPALQQQQVFFDNAGGSQVLGSVVDSIRDYFTTANVQLGASYAVGQRATARYDAAHDAGARFVNARSDEVVFGPSTTQLLRNLSLALGGPGSRLRPGDDIVVSAIDHEANVAPWVDLADRHDLVLKWWRPAAAAAAHDTNPKLLPEDLARLVGPRTRLVTFTHASNILGTITDVRAVADVAHAVGALVCVDGVAYAPHRPIDVAALGVDFYCFSWYKTYGPHVAMLYAGWAAQTHLRSLGHFFNPSATLADKLGLAGGSYELCQAVTHVVDYLGPGTGSEKWRAIEAHEHQLQAVLLDFLTARPDVTIFGVAKPDSHLRVSTVSFAVDGWDPKALVEAVEKDTRFAFRWGAFYSNRLVRDTLRLGPNGVVRVSMVHYNTLDEVKGLIKALEKVIDGKE
ncbi:hypothetical protein JDV02_007160 [Purpureocillium takamizusanense]|uniref:Aminotransferase class V domain-containing protein n=1 Tax=Purpureocillium takamizusanense TaxID=2060973 RepID=A0A9Q8QHQ9_9HYPO|nr:uncharacterized protein JDV02_007160 [Purpureocillium takamizusanense]UNI21144.1 hypothetical protein JDV02_007160 [Purpureocillium takamizusanense]